MKYLPLLLLCSCSLLPSYFEVGAESGDYDSEGRFDYDQTAYTATLGWDLQPREVVVVEEYGSHAWDLRDSAWFWDEPEPEPEPEITIQDTPEGTIITIPRAIVAAAVTAAMGAVLLYLRRKPEPKEKP